MAASLLARSRGPVIAANQMHNTDDCLVRLQHHGKINDVLEWFDQLMTGAEVLPVEASQRLLASRQGPLATQQKQWNAKLKAEEAAAMAEAR